MTLSQPRHRRPSRTPLYVRLGSLALIPVLTVGAIAMLSDDDPESGTLRVETESTDTTSDRAGESTSPDATSAAPDPGTSTPGTSGTTEGGTNPADDGSTGDTDSTAPDPTDTDPTQPDSTGPDTSGSPEPSSTPSPSSTPTDEPTRPGTPTDEPTTPDDPTPSPTSEPTTPDDPWPTVPVLSADESDLVEATNAVREDAGCAALRVDGRLMTAARGHSDDMSSRLYVSHVNPDGETPADRAEDQGYEGSVSENIWRGTRSAERVVEHWMSDSDARSRLLDCDYTSIGVGVESRLLLGAYWSQTLGTG